MLRKPSNYFILIFVFFMINEDDDVDGSEYAVVARFNSCWFFADDWIWDFRFNRFDSLLCGLLLQCESPLSVNLFTGEGVVWLAGFREMGGNGPAVSKDDGGGDPRWNNATLSVDVLPLSQHSNMQDLLHLTGLTKCRPLSIHVSSGPQLSRHSVLTSMQPGDEHSPGSF
ncbi:hypothetical protein L1987_53371 [Smallanthus sonchifolius]|uniref:Uncharacterized protein n=1 Tax=Smallanthus sonchifolius TaxID=185202 RepID=A0ACB9EVF5_9ASTR|nr:hypothetical protein L1987_53371 [Smallanthus sonchifolius]